MPLRLYNTLTRSVEDFSPLEPGHVRLYTCGPTVWNYAHIGNFRTFVFEDVLRRYLEYAGYRVTQVMNLTDVDDRTIKAANEAGVTLVEHTRPYTEKFLEDRDYMRVKPATHYPAATDHVPAMVELVEALLAKGVAYKGEDGSVYFAIDRFPAYGRLSNIEGRTLKTGARVASDEYAKEDARDFALWKAAKPEDEAVGAAWDTSFGRGRPGWHLECSAMSRQYLGDTIDIHCGGVDLIFPHHEDEIAQSEAATGKPFARFWLHGEFLLVEGTKMSKRYGNFLTARDLKESGFDAAAIRYLFGQTHYRKQINFSDEALKAAATGTLRLRDLADRLEKHDARTHGRTDAPKLADKLEADFRAAMDDDLDVPSAIAAIQVFVREANAALDRGECDQAGIDALRTAFTKVTDVLQIVPAPSRQDDPGLAKARALAEDRKKAKWAKDWKRADEIRAEIGAMGYDVRDTKDGGFELKKN